MTTELFVKGALPPQPPPPVPPYPEEPPPEPYRWVDE